MATYLNDKSSVEPTRKDIHTIPRLKSKKRNRYRRLVSIATQSVILFVFWLLLSGHYDATHIVMGALLALVVAFFTNDLFHLEGRSREIGEEENALFTFMCGLRMLVYLPWLFYNIIIANIQVAYLVLHPRMPIDPAIFQFRTQYRRTVSRVMLANSITLTPGTVTVDLKKGRFLVHALSPQSVTSLLAGKSQSRVGAIFGEEKEQPPAVVWAHSIQELQQ